VLNKIMNAGIRLSYSEYACFPQIPHTQDVLYALQLSDQKDERDYYSPAGAGNWGTYIENLMLVSAVVGADVLCMEPYDEAGAKKIVAQAIIDLCPEEAKCLFDSAFVEARMLVDETTPDVVRLPRRELILFCGCRKCARRIEDEGISRKAAPDAFLPRDNLPQTDQCAPPGGTCWVTGLVNCDGAHG
jgi:hypothetical protein